MKIPYSVLHVSGNVLFAARGGKIHSFSLDTNIHISTWKHPDVEKVATAVKAIAAQAAEAEKAVNGDTAMVEAGENHEPPAKRQKVQEVKDESEEATVEVNPEPSAGEGGTESQPGKGKGKGGKKSKNRQHNEGRNKEGNISRVPDRPVVSHITSTSDGAHLLAITGHDKVIWVFEHDGKGQLTQLSRRTMPKRPSSVAIAPDSQIICADKFGDVYSLPLIFTPSSSTGTPTPSVPAAAAKSSFKPSANSKTVHSKRNLRALSDQQRQMELRTKGDEASKTEGPDFEISLLLGHVSMLTSLVLGENEGRRYILTGDRDEHIRVSRYIPQAYVIEGFCFGHKEFVSNMIIPASRGEVLISGGGDEELFVWDWKAAKLLSKTSILSLAQEIAPELTKVAVSGLYSLLYPTEFGKLVYILAICEDIKAIFSWQLTPDNTLNHPSIIQLPGTPLSLSLSATDDLKPTIITAIDSSDPTTIPLVSIFSLTLNDEKLAIDSTNLLNVTTVDAEELDIPEKEIRTLLYTTENLRKQGTEQGEDAGGEENVVEEEGVEKDTEAETT
ncbi:Fc.00g061730.m01.CDS01 [Cosmosporella sp. VM-42]